MYKVDLSSAARKFYASTDDVLAGKLTRCFETLEADPRKHNNIKSLHGKLSEFRRFRVGDYRVIYRIDDAAGIVRVMSIVHRREAYE
jgi:mRNA interferase RelE/StbE